MADQETTDAPQQAPASTGGSSGGYTKRQVGLIGILLIVSGVCQFGNIYDAEEEGITNESIVNCIVGFIIYTLMGLSFIWIEVADKGDYLLVTTGPCRFLECGWGKEKVQYSEIRDYEISKTCWLTTPGLCCTGVRLMNQCSCCQCGCCGPAGSLAGGCCEHKTVRITINERGFGHNAADESDCCLEKCCLNNCFGANCYEAECGGRKKGEGCCFATCFNPCGVNCCAMNTMYVSTNDAQGLINLLNEKTGKQVTL